MRFLDYDIDQSKLFTRTELLEYLKENGEDNRALTKVRERYMDDFGNSLVWCYPISDGVHKGTFIVFVKEGFISIPYDIIEAVVQEVLELKHASMFDADSMQGFIMNWVMFSDDLVVAMKDIRRILAEE